MTTGERWQLQRLFAAPHRLAFAAGATVLALSALWWSAAMLARAGGHALPSGLPQTEAHGLVMVLGFMPLFFVGFLFTAGPRWLRVPAMQTRELLPAVLAQLAGWSLFLLAEAMQPREAAAVLASFGLAAAAAGWGQGWWRFVRLLRASDVPDRVHARLIAMAGAAGVIALWAAAAGVASGWHALVHAAVQGGLWLFVGLTFVAAAHRLIPFFSAAVLPGFHAFQPTWLLAGVSGVFTMEGAMAIAQALTGPLAAAVVVARALIEGVTALGLAAIAVRWACTRELRARMLAMLYLSSVWLAVSFAIACVSHVLEALSREAAAPLGVAALHALTMGFLGSTLITMGARISCGHGGRSQTADDVLWRLFWILQLAAVLRIAASLHAGSGLLAAAALAWAACCAAWALRYLRWYGRPRADGRPG